MKTLICVVSIYLLFIIVASPAQSQSQLVEGYTFLRGSTGPQVCLGRWVPPTDVALPGVCEGQILDVAQFTAVSSRLTADRLDQMLLTLASIDQKLSVNNDQVRQLIETTANTQTSIDQQVGQVNELLTGAISKRFDAIPKEIVANDQFKEELRKLRADILKEVEKHYQPKPTAPAK